MSVMKYCVRISIGFYRASFGHCGSRLRCWRPLVGEKLTLPFQAHLWKFCCVQWIRWLVPFSSQWDGGIESNSEAASFVCIVFAHLHSGGAVVSLSFKQRFIYSWHKLEERFSLSEILVWWGCDHEMRGEWTRLRNNYTVDMQYRFVASNEREGSTEALNCLLRRCFCLDGNLFISRFNATVPYGVILWNWTCRKSRCMNIIQPFSQNASKRRDVSANLIAVLGATSIPCKRQNWMQNQIATTFQHFDCNYILLLFAEESLKSNSTCCLQRTLFIHVSHYFIWKVNERLKPLRAVWVKPNGKILHSGNHEVCDQPWVIEDHILHSQRDTV